MPAFIVSHPSNELWGVLLFVRKLPKMTPQEYKDLVKAKGGEAGIEKGHEMEEMHHAGSAPAKSPAEGGSKEKH